jgi:hypothetical protein
MDGGDIGGEGSALSSFDYPAAELSFLYPRRTGNPFLRGEGCLAHQH